jgi:hypothetical protein
VFPIPGGLRVWSNIRDRILGGLMLVLPILITLAVLYGLRVPGTARD